MVPTMVSFSGVTLPCDQATKSKERFVCRDETMSGICVIISGVTLPASAQEPWALVTTPNLFFSRQAQVFILFGVEGFDEEGEIEEPVFQFFLDRIGIARP